MFVSCYIDIIYKYINEYYFVFVIYEVYFLSWFNSFFFPSPSSFLQPFWLFIASFVCVSFVFYCLIFLFSCFLPTVFLFFFVIQLRLIGRKHLITCFMYNNMFIYYYAFFGLYLLQQYCFFTTSLVLFPDSSSTLPFFSLF